MNWKKEYERWLNHVALDKNMKAELEVLRNDQETLEDCFYKTLQFGTGGMRGEIGPGTNRMNKYTIRQATEGLARYVEEHGEEAKLRGVAIAYDSRYRSPEFAKEAAMTLGNHGIKTHLFDELRPTPELSFAVRHLHAFAGIVITASHNPPQYNGYKVYGKDGGQLPPKTADAVIEKVNSVENELAVEVGNESALKRSGLLNMIGEEVDKAYLEQLKKISMNDAVILGMKDELKIVFTPLHGTANKSVRQGLKQLGFQHVTVVNEQADPDPEFSTVASPNPEEHAAFELAIEYGKDVEADLLLATDPDADRVGVAVKDKDGQYTVLTGNQTGALMLHYLLLQMKQGQAIPNNAIVLKTIVTSELGRKIAADFGVPTEDTLTGFKFIGEKIKEYHKNGNHTFLFGYEESYGYLIGDFVRDKDAVQACLFAAEVAAYYKSRGKSLYDGLFELYEEYGYYQEVLESLTLKGKQGAARIEDMMTAFRRDPLKELAGKKVALLEDYQSGTRTVIKENRSESMTLPSSNVIKYIFSDGAWLCLRPSGTEPKIKFYFGVREASYENSREMLGKLKAALMEKVRRMME